MDEQKALEEIGQTTIFDYLQESEQAAEEKGITKPNFYVGEKVLISLNRMDEESKIYFKYYYPGVIGKEGYITEIEGDQVEVFIEGSHIQMRKDELL